MWIKYFELSWVELNIGFINTLNTRQNYHNFATDMYIQTNFLVICFKLPGGKRHYENTSFKCSFIFDNKNIAKEMRGGVFFKICSITSQQSIGKCLVSSGCKSLLESIPTKIIDAAHIGVSRWQSIKRIFDANIGPHHLISLGTIYWGHQSLKVPTLWWGFMNIAIRHCKHK